MKRLITILMTLTLALSLVGQGGNTYKYPITIGSVGGTAGKLTLKGSTSGETVFQSSATGTTTVTGTVALPTTTSIGDVSSTELGYLNGATSNIQDQLNDTIDNATVFTKLAPDTVQHTANYTVAASDWGKDQHCLKATSILITIPANLTDWPVGGVMNFYGEGAGIMVFKKSSTVFISDKDSIATSRKGQAVTIKKIATNKYFLAGPLTD